MDSNIKLDENGLPIIDTSEIPDFLALDQWFDIDVSKDYLDFTEAYEPPKYTLSYSGVPFAPAGGIHALTGQAGNGKTMTFTQFIVAILNKQFGGLRYELSDRVPEPIVLYVDTEQERCNTIAVKNRVCEMAGWNTQQQRDNFYILMLRETATAQERWRKTLKAIFEKKPTVVFIDGLLDVVDDFNSNEECQKLIYKCMQVASHYDCSVWCLVHQNPNTTKLVGHLGSMLERKVTDVFQTIKETNDKTGEVTFRVEQKKARGRDVPKWNFRVLPVGGYGIPEQIDKSIDLTEVDMVRQWLVDGENLNYITFPATVTEFKYVFKKVGGISANDKLQHFIDVARQAKIILPQPPDEWEVGQKHPKYYLPL